METPRLYEEFVFWKQANDGNAWAWDIYENLKCGYVPPGVQSLPRDEIVEQLRTAFPNCVSKGSQLRWQRADGGSFKITPANSHFFVNLLGVSNSDKNRLLDVFEQFECPPYDAHLAERYGLEGMVNRDFSSDYAHARYDYLRGVGRTGVEEVYEPAWEDPNYVWDRGLWDEVYVSHLATHPENQSPGEIGWIGTF